MNPMIEITSASQRASDRKKRATSMSGRVSPASATPAEWCVGIVHSAGESGLEVTSGAMRAHASRAVSCLLEPTLGDSVACLRVAPNEVWIVAVLQRESGVPNTMIFSSPKLDRFTAWLVLLR